MKKIDKGIQFLQKNKELFQCPVCHSTFSGVEDGSLKCFHNHTFDVSKKGTVHFLMKQSKNDYSKELFENRYRISQAGLFDPILTEIYEKISNREGAVLDIGCGEGSHLNKLSEMGLQGPKVGFDLSQAGIQMAAIHFDQAFWCVADLSQPPFASHAFDTLLNIFSPSNYQEFKRMLKPRGQLIKVVPEENYLIELRQHFYGDDEKKKSYSNQDVVSHFSLQFSDYETKRVTYTFKLNPENLEDLLKMTPLSWSAEEEKLQTLLKTGLEEITVDVLLLIGIV